MAEETVEAQAKVLVEVVEEIVRIDRGQDRYRIKRADPYHRILKGTLLIYKVKSLTEVTAGGLTNTLLQSRESQSMSVQSTNTAATYDRRSKTPSALRSPCLLHLMTITQL